MHQNIISPSQPGNWMLKVTRKVDTYWYLMCTMPCVLHSDSVCGCVHWCMQKRLTSWTTSDSYPDPARIDFSQGVCFCSICHSHPFLCACVLCIHHYFAIRNPAGLNTYAAVLLQNGKYTMNHIQTLLISWQWSTDTWKRYVFCLRLNLLSCFWMKQVRAGRDKNI